MKLVQITYWFPSNKVRQNILKLFESEASKTKGFYLEARFNQLRPHFSSKMTEAVSLCEATEVKIEARSRIFVKFCIKYCFAEFCPAILHIFETT